MPSQVEISAHLDLDQAAVSRFLNDAAIDWRSATMDEIRIAYIRRLRGQAAGHKSASGDDLVAERVQTERVNRQLLMLQLHEKRGALVSVEQLRPQYAQMVGAFRTELLALADKLKGELDALHGINVDAELINGHVRAALEQLSRYEPGDRGAAARTGEELAAA